ncbi:hypothetical protein [Nocardia alba]|uniref:MspA protein n=1 Tax=Nocardia alba TaxID=225051 RepID=A0A4R1FXQ3_9NOCA|nr:hypothetical protein [Nocardia alba]TCJ99917.1 hypothetical protein DFR71_0902 [Nocardia alba]
MSIRQSTPTRAGLLAALAAATLLGTGGTANAVGSADWDLLPSGSVELGPPTGSSMGSVDVGSGTGSFDADLGSSAPRPVSSGSAALPIFAR